MIEIIILFLNFFNIGLFTIGGGYAMISLIKQIVLGNQWISEGQFINFIGISESTPGPFAVNIATFIGMERFGLLGAFVATLGIILPSFIIILIISRFYKKFMNNKYVKAAFKGIRPVVVGSVFAAAFSVSLISFFYGKVYTFNYINYNSLIIFLILFIAGIKFKSPIVIIILSAILGILVFGVFK